VEPNSSTNTREKVVFDCNIFLQFLLNPNGPAGRCVQIALDGKVELLVSDAVLDELHDLPQKAVAIKFGIDESTITRFVQSLLQQATYVAIVSEAFLHPIDPDDSCYVNLALAGNASLIVSRDKHLLGLNDATKVWSADFRSRFPNLRVVAVEKFLSEWDGRQPGASGKPLHPS